MRPSFDRQLRNAVTRTVVKLRHAYTRYLAGLCLSALAYCSLGNHAPANAEPPPVPPREIVLHILRSYQGSKPISLHHMPLVDRLKRSIARADLASDDLLEPTVSGIQNIRISRDSFRELPIPDRKKRMVEAEFTLEGKNQHVIFAFDRSSGEWLITDIRATTGLNLRKALQISP